LSRHLSWGLGKGIIDENPSHRGFGFVRVQFAGVKGDGKEFAQLWAADRSGDPKFSDTLPFSGVRFFEFTTTGVGLKGRVWDPLVIINKQKELPFELAYTPNIRL
jgi:hypothetical protein